MLSLPLLLLHYTTNSLTHRLSLSHRYTQGTREDLVTRFKRWIVFPAIVADVAAQAAHAAAQRMLDGAGGVFSYECPTPGA